MRLVLDNDQNLDANNIYLPETKLIAGVNSSAIIDLTGLAYGYTAVMPVYFGVSQLAPSDTLSFLANNYVSIDSGTYASAIALCAHIKTKWDLLVGSAFTLTDNLDGTLTIEAINNVATYEDYFVTLTEDDFNVTLFSIQLQGYVEEIPVKTASLAPISKSRKSYFLNDTLFLRGFCGFAGLAELPLVDDSQSDFFSIEDNKCTIDSENGIGFEHKLANIEDGTHYFACALRLNGSNEVSDTLSEHLVFKITRSGSYLLVSLVDLSAKTVANGWEVTNEVPVIELADELPYASNYSISFIYPNASPSAIQFLVKDPLESVVKAITLTSGADFNAILAKVSTNTFALFHVLANVGANADITVIKSLAK